MAKRVLYPDICTSESIEQLDYQSEVLFYRLLVAVDDFGRFSGKPRTIKGTCLPFKDVSLAEISECLSRLSDVGIIELYEVGGTPYLHFVNWTKFQKVRAKASRYPAPPEKIMQNVNPCEHMSAHANICEHMQTYDDTCKHMLAHDSTCEHMSAKKQSNSQFVNETAECDQKDTLCKPMLTYASTCKHMSAHANICQHMMPNTNTNTNTNTNIIDISTLSISTSDMDISTSAQSDEDIAQIVTEPTDDVVVATLICKDGEYAISQQEQSEWQKLYPKLDVAEQIRLMQGWLYANPSKRKTKRGIARFINGWLSRATQGSPSYSNTSTSQGYSDMLAQWAGGGDT